MAEPQFVSVVEQATVMVPHLVSPIEITRRRQPNGGWFIEVDGLPLSHGSTTVGPSDDVDGSLAVLLERVAIWAKTRAEEEPWRRATDDAWEAVGEWFSGKEHDREVGAA